MKGACVLFFFRGREWTKDKTAFFFVVFHEESRETWRGHTRYAIDSSLSIFFLFFVWLFFPDFCVFFSARVPTCLLYLSIICLGFYAPLVLSHPTTTTSIAPPPPPPQYFLLKSSFPLSLFFSSSFLLSWWVGDWGGGLAYRSIVSKDKEELASRFVLLRLHYPPCSHPFRFLILPLPFFLLCEKKKLNLNVFLLYFLNGECASLKKPNI